MKKNKFRILIVIIFLSYFITSPILVISGSIKSQENNFSLKEEYLLPPPMVINMSFEESMMRRASMRNFTDEPVTDEELSTILWAAFGLRDDNKMTIPKINGFHATVIYVLLNDVYKYNPFNHSLVLYKTGDYRDIVGWQYSAPVQICLCWNTDIADANLGCIELGCVGQNIYFAANAIGLGTVITAQGDPAAITPVGLPENEHGMGVMPLGHLEINYDFKYRPMLFSLLPRVRFSDNSLTSILENRDEVTSWDSRSISREDLSYLIWASYGYSYFIDGSNTGAVERHHTVPSAHGYYPFHIYAATESGVYRYIYGLYNIDIWGLPVISFLYPVNLNDKRIDIAQATELYVSDASLNIIIVLDIDKTNQWDDLSDESLRWIWYYEAGAAAHNILLQATSRGLAGNILTIDDKESICSLLKLNNERFDPMLVVPVG
jgi:nitroreductase